MTRDRRRQTRLAFTPLPSSSPATNGYNKQIQDRAAAVSYDSPTKRRKLRGDDESKDGLFDGMTDMPTPAASARPARATLEDNECESDNEPCDSAQQQAERPTRPTTRRKAQQRQLDFSRARDSETFSSPLRLSSSARPQSSARAGLFGTQSHRGASVSSDESDELVSPAKLIAKKKAKVSKRSEGRKIGRLAHEPVEVSSDASSENVQVKNGPSAVDGADDSEDDDEMPVAGTQRRGRQQSNVVAIESEDDGEDMPTTSGMQRRKRRTKQASLDSFIDSSPPAMIESDDSVEIIEQPKKRRRQHESRSEDEEVATPTKRKSKLSRRTSRREQDELDEDLEFLQPASDVEESPRQPRNTQSAKKSAKQQALEQLKRRRSGQMQQPPEETEQDDTSADYENGYNNDDELSEDQHAPIHSSQMFRQDDDDKAFIDSEEEELDPLGIPEGLPIEYSRYASMKAKELFEYAIEWMVQKKINPAFSMDDPIYKLTFNKLDMEVKALAGSKFQSSVWTPNFTMSLVSRPDIAYEPIDRSEPQHAMRDHCDACNRSQHPATYQIQFQGKPYHSKSLDEVAGNDDDDDSSSEDEEDHHHEPSYDATGREVPAQSTIYYVGKFCMSNARTAHSLQHWRYHLYEWVVTWLIRNGLNTPEKIVERDRWSTKKRRKEANKVTDRMKEEGVVKTLWRDFRDNIYEARNSKQGRFEASSP